MTTWYVDYANGNDGNSGLTPEQAFATNDRVLSACAAWEEDKTAFLAKGGIMMFEVECTLDEEALFDTLANCIWYDGEIEYQTAVSFEELIDKLAQIAPKVERRKMELGYGPFGNNAACLLANYQRMKDK
jgi:hypothetical protein